MRSRLRTLAGIVLTLAAGLAGGALFKLLELPMPWLLGAIVGAAAAAMGGLPVGLPRWLRNAVLVVIGLMTGSGIRPDTLANVTHWPVSMSAVALYVAVCTASLYGFLRRFAGFDPVTAYFASAPGGLSGVSLIAVALGIEPAFVIAHNLLRVLLIMFAEPLVFRIIKARSAAP